MKTKPIILVSGEPKSIFIEIFLKSLNFKRYKCPLILICNKNLFLEQAKFLNYKMKLNCINLSSLKNFNKNIIDKKKINLIDVNFRKPFNKINSKKYIKNSFKIAFELIKKGVSYKLLNGPINKETFLNKKYLGITEFIADYFSVKNFGMLIYNNKLSVCPLTTHLPIKLVSRKITKLLIQDKLKTINNFYINKLKIKPRIGVTGLNPHCESISSFNEDKKIISPAIKFAKKRGISASGPFPADTIFLEQNRQKFDVILGMYHDQVLTPLKTLYEYDAINITMGLPFLRVSPDHGPNEKMVNKNLSNPKSLFKALEFLDNN
jgi:4-hydroxy-L-threonine phosphate dehydrogenase PdxA